MTKHIAADMVVSLNYQMSDAAGALIDKNLNPIVYLHGGYDNILPAVEAALRQTVGQTVSLPWIRKTRLGKSILP